MSSTMLGIECMIVNKTVVSTALKNILNYKYHKNTFNTEKVGKTNLSIKSSL